MPLDEPERIVAVLYAPIMGLTSCHKTSVFLHLFTDTLTEQQTWLPRTRERWRSPATFDLRSRVAGVHYASGVRRSFVCMSVSLSQFSSRNQHRPDSAIFCGSVSKQCTNLYT